MQKFVLKQSSIKQWVFFFAALTVYTIKIQLKYNTVSVSTKRQTKLSRVSFITNSNNVRTVRTVTDQARTDVFRNSLQDIDFVVFNTITSYNGMDSLLQLVTPIFSVYILSLQMKQVVNA